MLGKQSPWIISPRGTKPPPQADNHGIGLTTQQISQIARIFDPDDEDDGLAKARTAWRKFQSSRKRDAVYGYLTAVFGIVVHWTKERRTKVNSDRALGAASQHQAIRSDDPFTVVVFCTSDSSKVDAKTRSKWSRALRHAERFKPDHQNLMQFIKSKGGINECAGQPKTSRTD